MRTPQLKRLFPLFMRRSAAEPAIQFVPLVDSEGYNLVDSEGYSLLVPVGTQAEVDAYFAAQPPLEMPVRVFDAMVAGGFVLHDAETGEEITRSRWEENP